MSKKLLSFLALLMAMFVTPQLAKAWDYIVYVDVSAVSDSWTEPHFHCWPASGDAYFNNVAMTRVGTSDIWKYEGTIDRNIAEGSQCKFNHKGWEKETHNSVSFVNGHVYVVEPDNSQSNDKTKFKVTDSGKTYDEYVAHQMIYVYNAAGWDKVKIFIHNNSNEQNAWWNGVEMTYDSSIKYVSNGTTYTGLYVYEVPSNLAQGFAFFSNSTGDNNHRWPLEGKNETNGNKADGDKDGARLQGRSVLYVTGQNTWTIVGNGDIVSADAPSVSLTSLKLHIGDREYDATSGTALVKSPLNGEDWYFTATFSDGTYYYSATGTGASTAEEGKSSLAADVWSASFKATLTDAATHAMTVELADIKTIPVSVGYVGENIDNKTDWSNAVAMTQTDRGIFTARVEFTGDNQGNNKIRFKAGDTDYGTDNGSDFSVNNSDWLSFVAAPQVWMLQKGKYDVTVDWLSQSVKFEKVVGPTISVDAANGTYFKSKSATINFTFGNTSTAWYRIGNGENVTLTDANRAVAIGNADGASYQEVTVTYAASDDATGDDIKTVRYILTTDFVCFVDLNGCGWTTVKAHLWGDYNRTENDISLTYVDGNIYRLNVSDMASSTGINGLFFNGEWQKLNQTDDIDNLEFGACYTVGYTNDNSKRPVTKKSGYLPPVTGPEVRLAPESGHSFASSSGNSITVTATNLEGIAWYRIGDGESVNITDGSYVVTLPDNDSYDDMEVTVTYAVDEDAPEQTATYSIPGKEVEGNAPTGTLPVLYLNFYKGSNYDNAIIDKDLSDKNYRDGEYWLEVNGCDSWIEGAANIGSREAPLPLRMKARGNFTRRGFAKKPYRLKLDKKQNMLGLTGGEGSKDYTLLTHADDDKAYLRNLVGFELARLIGLPWSPSQQPVEVVINGDYRGIYFLTEAIKVDAERVNIEKQKDEETNPANVTGGWLVELDNYAENADNQIDINEKSTTGVSVTGDGRLRITFDTPEVLSDIQRRFLTDQFIAINNAVATCASDDEIWKYLDLDDAVRFYLVMEMMHHTEAYHGSTFLQRNKNTAEAPNQKWHFSPLWDMGHAFEFQGHNKYIYDDAAYGNTWIKSIRKNNTFNARLKQTWDWFVPMVYENGHLTGSIAATIDAYIDHIAVAAKADAKCWEGMLPTADGNGKIAGTNYDATEVVDNSDISAAKATAVGDFEAKIAWLMGQDDFGTPSNAPEPVRTETAAAPLPAYISDPDNNSTLQTIYVYNDAGWDRVRIYLHNTVDDELANWNSRPDLVYDATLQYDGTDQIGLYKFVVPAAYADAYVCFTNGNASQRWTQYMKVWDEGTESDAEKVGEAYLDGARLRGKSWYFVTGESTMTQLNLTGDNPDVHPYIPADVKLVGTNMKNVSGEDAESIAMTGSNGIFTARIVVTAEEGASIGLSGKVTADAATYTSYGPAGADAVAKIGKKNDFDNINASSYKLTGIPVGVYDVTADWIKGKLTFTLVAPEELYIIGYDGSWDCNDRTPMTKNGLTYTQRITVTIPAGDSNLRELRLNNGTGNFGPETTHTLVKTDGVTANRFSIDETYNNHNGFGNENTWSGLQEGTYDATVDWATGSLYLRKVIPAVTLEPEGTTFIARTKTFTFNFVDTDEAWYSLDGGTTKTTLTADNKTVTLGSMEAVADQTFTVTYGATAADATGKTVNITLKYAPYKWYLHHNFDGGAAWEDSELVEEVDGGTGTGIYKGIIVRTADDESSPFVLVARSGSTELWYKGTSSENTIGSGVASLNVGLEDETYNSDLNFDGAKGDRYEITWNPSTGALSVTKLLTWYIVGGQFGGWGVETKSYPMTDRGNGVYSIKVPLLWAAGYSADWFRFHDGTNLHGATAASYILNQYNVMHAVSSNPITDTTDWSFGWRGTEEPCFVFLDTHNWQMWVDKNPNLPEEVAYRGLTFMPRAVRNAEGDWSAWDENEPIVVIRGESTTAGRLQPDWELLRQSDGSYKIERVNLRNKELEAVVIYKNSPTVAIGKFTIEDAPERMGAFYDITVTPKGVDADPTVAYALSTEGDKTPPYFGIFGYAFHQLDDDKIDGEFNSKYNTPNSYTNLTGVGKTIGNTVLGWQESYVLTDDQARYVTDLNGSLIYSSHWPPRNPIYFSTIVNGKPFELLSTQLTFTQRDYSEVSSSEGRYANGSDWVSTLRTGSKGALYNGLELVEGTRYARYVVPAAWLQGAFKIVNGWNTGTTSDRATANWNQYYKNWGIGNDTNTTSGYGITLGQTESLGDDKGNLYFGEPTYYNTVELFVPVNEDGTVNNVNGVKLYTTANVGQPSISAIASKTSDDVEENNTGQYTIQFRYLNGATVKSIKITRYDAVNSDRSKDRSEWTTFGTKDVNNAYTFEIDPSELREVKIEGNTVMQYIGKDEELYTNKRYFYVMDYTVQTTDENGSIEGPFDATSNPFSLLSQTYTPEVNALQLIELTHDGLSDLNDYIKSVFDGYTESTTADPQNRIYISRKSGTTNNHYLVWRDGSENETRHIATIPEDIIKMWPKYEEYFNRYNWSSSYMVVGFIGNSYASEMSRAYDSNALLDVNGDKGYQQYPNVYAKKGESISSDDFIDENVLDRYVLKSAKDGSDLYLYATFIDNDGNLDKVTFSAGMKYWYRPVGSSVIAKETFASSSNTPVAPRPWGVSAKYEYETVDEPQDVAADYISFEVPSAVDHETMKTVYVKPEQLANRRLNVIYEFNRPNVTDEIRDYYDIQYAIGVYTINERDYNEATNTRVITKGLYHDTETDLDNVATSRGRYHITVHGVNPDADIYPALGIYATTYMPNDFSNSREARRATYGATQKVNVLKTDEEGHYLDASDRFVDIADAISHEREFDSWYPARFELKQSGSEDIPIQGLHLNYTRENGKYNWVYQGHAHFEDDDKLEGEGLTSDITPNLYFVELANGTTMNDGYYSAYPYIATHDPDHHRHNKGETHDIDIFGFYKCDTDPLVGVAIGRGFVDETSPTFYATPLYIFDRVANEMAITGDSTTDFTELKPVNARAAAPGRFSLKRRMNVTAAGSPGQSSYYPHIHVTPTLYDADAETPAGVPTYQPANEGAFDNYVLFTGTPITQVTEIESGIVTGLDNIAADLPDGVEIYYDVHGREVPNPGTGVYIRVTSRGAEKVYLK